MRACKISGFILERGRKQVAPYIVRTHLLTMMKKFILSASEIVWYSLAPPVGFSISLLHVHLLWKQVSVHARLSFPISLFISHGLPISSVQVYQQVNMQWLNDKPPSSPKLSPYPLCFCGCWNTVQDPLQIVYFVCSIRHYFVRPGLICCPGRALERKTNTQLLNRKVTGREIVRVHWALLLWNICAVLQCRQPERNDSPRMKAECRRYFYILQTQDVVSQPMICLWGFPFLTIISKFKTDKKNASFKMRSILWVKRKPLKNRRSFCQAYELQITGMLAQENPYLPSAHCHLLCDVSCRCQAVWA